MNNGETVFIVDSDTESRKRVCGLVQSMKLRHEAYSLAQDFLDQYDPQRPGCAILEVRIPDVSGLQLQQQLAEQTPAVPVIFLTVHASVPVVVRAIQQGAVNFLQKPAEEQELWDTIQQALQLDRERRGRGRGCQDLQKQLELLTREGIRSSGAAGPGEIHPHDRPRAGTSPSAPSSSAAPGCWRSWISISDAAVPFRHPCAGWMCDCRRRKGQSRSPCST